MTAAWGLLQSYCGGGQPDCSPAAASIAVEDDARNLSALAHSSPVANEEARP